MPQSNLPRADALNFRNKKSTGRMESLRYDNFNNANATNME